MESKGTVCVTGAGGYVASWLVKLLLLNGYTVHGTVRDPHDEKNAHLKNLENAKENLKIFKAHLFDYDSIAEAIDGCIGVFHVASPVPPGSVPNPEVELVETAVKGTLNVLKASVEANVKRVLFVSSIAAVLMNPSVGKDGQVVDETCWSDKEFCRKTNNWYCVSKTEAEFEALEFAEKNGLDLVTVCPSTVLGPKLQSSTNASSLILIKLLKGELQNGTDNVFRKLVDVRDVAQALVIVYEKSESEGRYLCNAHSIWAKDLVKMLKNIYPHSKYPERFNEVDKEENKISSEKLQKLGWTFRPLEETIVDSVKCFKEDGILG